MTCPPASKLGLNNEEVAVIQLRLANGGWASVLREPPIVASAGVLLLTRQARSVSGAQNVAGGAVVRDASVIDGEYSPCAWTVEGPCITDFYFVAEKQPYLHKRRFLRAYGCAVAMRGISRIIPTFSFISVEGDVGSAGVRREKVENCTQIRFVGESGMSTVATPTEVAYAKLQFNQPPMRIASVSGSPDEGEILTFAHLLGMPRTTMYEVISVYLQVVLGVCVANKHVRFAHNRLLASNVVLASYARLFSVNFEEVSVLCTNYIAMIVNYDHAQYSYVRDGGAVYDVCPEVGEQSAMNLVPHFSSDAYTFTRNCCLLSIAMSRNHACSSAEGIAFAERGVFFKEMLAFFMSPVPADTTRWPVGIPPEGHGYEGFLDHLRKVVSRSGFDLFRPTYPFRTNVHLQRSLSRESTWYAADVRSLVAYEEPSPEMTGPVGISTSDDAHVMLFCSKSSDAAMAEVLHAIAADKCPSTGDLARAMEEIPFLLLISAETRSRILATPTGRAMYEKSVNDILSRLIYSSSKAGFTVRDYLCRKDVRTLM